MKWAIFKIYLCIFLSLFYLGMYFYLKYKGTDSTAALILSMYMAFCGWLNLMVKKKTKDK